MLSKITTKLMRKQKRMVLFIRIEVYYLILPNQTEIVFQYTTRTKFKMVFPILKCNICVI